MVIYINSNDVNSIWIHPETHQILKALRNSKPRQNFNDVVMDLLNDSINNNPQLFLKLCRRGGIDICLPGYSSHWSIPEYVGSQPRKIDLRKCVVKYIIVKGVE
jgi:hypothetical protein